MPDCGQSHIVATHPVHADAGRRRRRTDVHPRDTRAVEVHSDPRSHHHLDGIVGATDDVATDVVGVVGVEFRGSSGEAGDDSVAETGGESLDLVQYRVGGVAGAPVRYMRVGIQGVDGADRATRVCQILLRHNDERTLGHPSRMGSAFGCDHLIERSADIHGARRPAVLQLK